MSVTVCPAAKDSPSTANDSIHLYIGVMLAVYPVGGQKKGRPPTPAQPASNYDSGARTAAPVELQGASVLAMDQPRKPEAAHLVDWFYVTSSYKYQ